MAGISFERGQMYVGYDNLKINNPLISEKNNNKKDSHFYENLFNWNNLETPFFGLTSLVSGYTAGNALFKYTSITRSLANPETVRLLRCLAPAGRALSVLLRYKLIALTASFAFGYSIGTLGYNLFTYLNGGRSIGEVWYDWYNRKHN